MNPIIVDKCRVWTLKNNVKMLKRYISPDIKIIVLERSITDIVKSFVKLYRKNNIDKEKEEELVVPDSEPIMRPLKGINYSKKTIKIIIFCLFLIMN